MIAKVDVRDGCILIDGIGALYAGEVVRCLLCGSLSMAESDGCGCGVDKLMGIYTLSHVEDDEGNRVDKQTRCVAPGCGIPLPYLNEQPRLCKQHMPPEPELGGVD